MCQLFTTGRPIPRRPSDTYAVTAARRQDLVPGVGAGFFYWRQLLST